ncbi:hypothetical protein CsSME_00030852 [Camellia sinensis var. sinensis]
MAMDVCDALISTIGGKVVDLLVGPVGRQFDYVFHRAKHTEDLKNQVQNLEAQKKRCARLHQSSRKERRINSRKCQELD